MKKIILASQSPRRCELLSYLELSFDIAAADVDERICQRIPIEEAIMQLAAKKAKAISEKHPESIVIGADTVVVIEDEILGKPKNEEDAVSMLKKLSGKTHQVITGVCILLNDHCDQFYNMTNVTFYPLEEEEILHYVESKDPLDKAGAYAIQGKSSVFIEKIDGDYYSVMGLPIAQLKQHLKKFLDS